MEALADMVATEVAAAVDLGDDGGDDAGGEDGEGGEEEEEDPNEFVHVDEKFYYLVSFFRRDFGRIGQTVAILGYFFEGLGNFFVEKVAQNDNFLG